MAPRVEVDASFSVLRITIDGLPAVHLDKTRVVGFYAWWLRSTRTGVIEFQLTNAEPMKTEWDDLALWRLILKKLSEAM